MENTLFENAKKLYDHKLYESVIPVAKFLRTAMKNDRNVATLEMEYQVQLYLSISEYKVRQFRASLRHLENLIHQRKLMVRHKNACLLAIESAYPEFGDIEVRRRGAECYREIGNPKMATDTLLQIPVKLRTPRVNLMLARLQHPGNGNGSGCANKAEALFAYKEVVRECPMALQEIEALLELKVDGNEVNSLVLHAATVPGNFDWLGTWIQGLAQMFDCKHLAAARTFQKLQDTSQLHCSEHLMMALGRCLYYHGNYSEAEQMFSATIRANPDNVEAIGLLAVVRSSLEDRSSSNTTDMDRLYAQVTSEPKYSAEHWFVHAQSMFDSGKFERGLSFVDQCLASKPRHQEALILRPRLLASLGRQEEAAVAFRMAQAIVPYRFEVFRGLFQCYLDQKRFKEAHAVSNWTLQTFPNSPRSLTMFGRTLFNTPNPLVKKSARKFAQKSLKIDPNYSPAVVLMADICQFEGAPEDSIKLLEDHVSRFPQTDLFTRLGDILRCQLQPIKALEYYYKALGRDPKCELALEGISLLRYCPPSSLLEEDGTTKVDPQPTTPQSKSLECVDSDFLKHTVLSSKDSLNGREASSSPAARSGQDGDGDGAVWHDVDTDINYDGH
ncbi:anaphase-promoting complex subunit 7-like isoform X1 [Drosophila ficusphila]|uniref:anaphase-promoting complex subunit 7-like isoform X1 n=1 Tax=Drosophila ficusphila TaxID=30025 RepID=UPI0007E71D55|nr:anaphase-promoting complex subunit 7-like isoform X1 [Drosophila ficusphila]